MATSHVFQKVRRTVYVGTFAYPTSPTDLTILEDTAIGVDEHGRIAFIEVSGDALDKKVRGRGWEEYDVVRAESASTVSFWFPGFVGKFCLHRLASPYDHSRLCSFQQMMLFNQACSDGPALPLVERLSH